MVDDAIVIAAEKSSSYPFSRIPLISTTPRPPMSATALPDIPAKIMLAITLTWPRPPGIQPINASAKSKMRRVTPPVFINRPASVNSGKARSRNDVIVPVLICVGRMVSGTWLRRK